MPNLIQLLPPETGTCWLIKKAFSPSFCQQIIQEHHHKFEAAKANYPTSYRNNERQIKEDKAFAAQLFQHIQPYLPKTIKGEGLGKYEQGTWQLQGLNERVRLCRYLEGQYFNKHLDGVFHRSPTEQSKLTFMIYLNGSADFEGGRTLFFPSKSSEEIIASYQPEQGDLIIFDHNLWHSGEQVTAGEKYVLRSDVLYERTSPLNISFQQPYSEGHGGYIWRALPLGEELATCGRDKTIKIWDKQGQKKQVLEGHERSILDLLLLPTGDLVSCSRDQSLRLWRSHKGYYQCYKTLKQHQGTVLCLCGLEEGQFCSAGADGQLFFYDKEGSLTQQWAAHTEWIWGLTALPNGRLLSIGEEGLVKLWEVETGALLWQQQLGTALTAVAYDALEEKVYIGGVEGALFVLKDQQKHFLLQQHFQAHQDKIWSIAIKGQHLATGGEDNQAILRDKTTFKVLQEYAHANFVQDVLFYKGQLLTVSYDGCIGLFDL